MKNLLHLSFNANLEGMLKPRQPHGSGLDESGKFKEDLPARVSFSPDIQGCFSAIYPNISKFFEEVNNGKGFPFIYIYVYAAVLTGKETFIPEKLVRAKVWDAHVTREICISTEVSVKKVAKIKIPNPYRSKKVIDITAHPFNDSTKPEVFVSPEITYQITETYDPSVKFK